MDWYWDEETYRSLLGHVGVVNRILHFHSGRIGEAKPAPDAHRDCMAKLGVTPAETVAIEDSADGVASAAATGAFVVATPGRFVADQDFRRAGIVVSCLGDHGSPADFITGPAPDEKLVALDWLRTLDR